MTLCSWDTTLASLENVPAWNGSYESQQTLQNLTHIQHGTRIFIVCAVENAVSLHSHSISILLYCNPHISHFQPMTWVVHSSTELRVLKSLWGWGKNFSTLKFSNGVMLLTWQNSKHLLHQRRSPKHSSGKRPLCPGPRSLDVDSSDELFCFLYAMFLEKRL